MPNGLNKRCVTILGLPELYQPEFVRTALDYGRHRGHWRFVGRGRTPFIRWGQLHELQVDGVIGRIDHSQIAHAVARTGAKAVSTGDATPAFEGARVVSDKAAIGRLGARYLLERGWTQLAYFGPASDPLSDKHLSAFEEAVTDAGHTCHTRLFTDEGPGLQDVADLIPGWLDELPKPVAIMGSQDYVARLTVTIAVEKGLRVPDDVAVLGVGNNPWASIMAALPISTIQLNNRRIAYTAAETLDGLMAGGPIPPTQWVPPIDVITRRSTDITMVKDRLVTDVLAYMRDHCGEGLTVDDVMAPLDVSRRHLEKRMKSVVGLTPQLAIFRAQVDRAKTMLAESDSPIDVISRACGFRQQARLNQVFKRETGMTPGQYRQHHAR